MARLRLNLLDLPSEIQTLCFQKLVCIKDYIRFGAVCRSWNSIYLQNRHHLPIQNPMLMLSIKGLWDKEVSRFYDFSNKKFHHYSLEVSNEDDDCIGTAGCWLVIHKGDDSIILFNPFLLAGNEITLPQLGNHIDKVVLSENPGLNSNYVVMAIGSSNRSFDIYKSGNNDWISIEFGADISDVIWYVDKFYILSDMGVSAFDINCPNMQFVNIAPRLDYVSGYFKYLVESGGDFLLVKRITVQRSYDMNSVTDNIQVYKLDRISLKWTEIKNLCGRALFVGDNTSMSLLASTFPECKPNCIYFNNGPEDSGIFNMDDGSIESYPLDMEKIEYPFPCWIIPSLLISGVQD